MKRISCILNENLNRFLFSLFAKKKSDAFFSTDIFPASVTEIDSGKVVEINKTEYLGDLSSEKTNYLP